MTLQYPCRSSGILNLHGCPLPLPPHPYHPHNALVTVTPGYYCCLATFRCSMCDCLYMLGFISNRLSDTATYDPNNLPPTTEQGQTGTNQCGTGSNQTSQCQNLYVNSLQDFCLWGSVQSSRACNKLNGLNLYSPPDPNSVIGNVEEIVVAYCTSPGRGTRLFPSGTILQAHLSV